MDNDTLQRLAAIADPLARARAIGQAMDEQQKLFQQAVRMRRQAVAAARAKGHQVDEIATVLGVTPGRISQMSKGLKMRKP